MSKSGQCAKYQYVVTPAGPKILPVDEAPCKDEESPAEYNAGGYLPIHVSDAFSNGRYRVVRKLGWGHFSTVWLVKDTKANRHSALKVIKSAGRYAETARDEIKLLSQVSAASPFHPGRDHIVSFLDSFTHVGPESSHICIVFEPLGENLLSLIERNKKTGVPPTLVKVIAKQVLLGLQYLHDECDLVHTDIKPENILISIPDVEEHIYNELTHSPSPTSRRVGVPPPTKSRLGVSIPQNRGGPRRQVQIWESQPLSSPRSAASLSFGSLTAGASYGGSNPNSQPGSYVSPSQMIKLHSAPQISGMASASPNSAAGPSGLSMTAPPKNVNGNGKPPSSFKQPGTVSPSNSTPSSSSSSISSTLTSSNTLSSSAISTPPTSLSHSLGNAVVGLMKMSLTAGNQSPVIQGADPIGVPVKGKPAKSKIADNELEDAPGSSWKDVIGSPGSWRNRISQHFPSSSPRDIPSKPKRQSISGHSRNGSGIPSGSWKDPGISAPAPVVLVSAHARPGDDSGAYFDLTSMSVASSSSGFASDVTSHSQSSSATVTEARPSPLDTPIPPTARPPSTSESSRGPLKLVDDRPAANGKTHKKRISLLSQTAPIQINDPQTPSDERSLAVRQSPIHHISQLSAHMLQEPPPDYRTPPSEQPNPLNIAGLAASPGTVVSRDEKLDPLPSSLALSRPSDLIPSSSSAPSVPQDVPPISQSDSSPKLDLPPIDAPVPRLLPPISVKIADLGNATPSQKHFTEDIQTRQYRAPEAILGRKDWDTRADVWSVACVVFELLTAEYLFDPQGQTELFTKDDDHMAQIIELLGDFPVEVKMGGKYSRELFDHTGALRYIKTLKPWPLQEVMNQKYGWSEPDSALFCDFVRPMLTTDMRQRAHARDMVDHPWLEVDPSTLVGL